MKPSLIISVATVAVVILAMDSLRILADTPILDQWIRLETHYFYALVGLLLPIAYLVFPMRAKGSSGQWHDKLLALLCLCVTAYFYANSERILDEGWEFGAPTPAIIASGLLWLLILEALRRAAGNTLFVIAALFSIYPIFAEQMPGPISGLSASWSETAAYHLMSIESVLGVPFRAFANLVIGFLIFGVALQKTGGGQFFIDLANALLGGTRGGPAKVAIFSSGLMGSMSGSVITNVVTTGQLTIPAMKKAGFTPTYAAGVEACASTGGVLLPPIMGSTAFVMATMLEVAYYKVALAALIPALLYFIGLFIQIDFYSARTGIHNTATKSSRKITPVLVEGWFYLLAFSALVFFLLVLQREAVAPYYATLILLLTNQLSKNNRWCLSDVAAFLQATGRLLTEIMVILAGVGFIVGALSLTGLSGTLVNDLLFLAGGSTLVLLLMGAATSFVLGIGMTVTAAYIFLAIILAPALTQAGLDPMAVHLFILYWAMLSFITPPVALGAFAAASIADAPPVKTGFTAMALGSVIYFIPFFFVWNPALTLQASGSQIVISFAGTLLAITLIASGLQGYLPIFGKNLTTSAAGNLSRVALVALGLGCAISLNRFYADASIGVFTN